jgi:hypothetical protein
MQKAMFNVAPLTIHSESCAIDNLKMTSSMLAALKSVRFFSRLAVAIASNRSALNNNGLAAAPKPSILNKSIDLHQALLHSLHHSGFLPNATKGRTLDPERPAYHCATATPLFDLGWHVSTEAFFHCRGMQ